MKLSEIFTSIQGEGISMGVPSVFVRTAECNLRCTWCDTKYTWDWDHHDRATEVEELAWEVAVERIVATASGARTIVITGGEPMLQQDDVLALARALHAQGFRLEVETSGSIEPTAALREAIDQWNVSPKLANSGNKLAARLRSGPLTAFSTLPTANFKFVICTPEDVLEVVQLATTYGIAPARITLMPEGRTPDELAAKVWLADVCTARGFRLGTRLHVLLWGSKRGV
ncbi:MAG: 7-carboxy-7-deazaguanine synthase QueE [Proteobacteria bacterium]|nr:7-carboxy-7-deazaguanine synthase QueE [Pseudomonadota bacterium]